MINEENLLEIIIWGQKMKSHGGYKAGLSY